MVPDQGGQRGFGYVTAIIAYGSTYIIPHNDIENMRFEMPVIPINPIVVTCDQPANASFLWIIRVESGEWVDVTCVSCSAIGTLLDNGNLVIFDGTRSLLAGMETLEGKLFPAGLGNFTFVSAMRIHFRANGVETTAPARRMTLSFAIPNGLQACQLVILFWDKTLNDGKGGWVEIPSSRVPAWLDDGLERLEASVSQTGIYVLVCR